MHVGDVPASVGQRHSLLSQTMRQCRLRANISRDRLAPKAYVAVSTLEKWERGERIPTLDNLRHWFDALHVNDWYREKIIALSQPAMFELPRDSRPMPTADELRQLDGFPFPACFRSVPTYDVIAANDAYRRLFPGIAVPAIDGRLPNLIEWMLLSDSAREVIKDWRRHTHVLVNSLQVQSPGLVPQERLDEIVAMCNRASEFRDMWDNDVTTDAIRNTELTVREPVTCRWIHYTARSYRAAPPQTRWELQLLTPQQFSHPDSQLELETQV